MAHLQQLNAGVGRPLTTLHDFHLFDLIACGRSGAVHYSLQQGRSAKRRDGLLAVKRLAPQLAQDAGVVERWLAAATRASQLSHPGICRILRADTCEGNAYCVMELCAGLDLARIRARLLESDEAIPVDCAALIMNRVAAALEAAHSLRGPRFVGLYHGDLTLSDVMVGYDGSVKLLNVGVSAALGPASALGERDANTAGFARADVAALGHCLLELLRGASRSDPSASGAGRIDEACEGSNATALRTIAARAVETRAGARFTSAGAVRKALDQYLASRDVPITDHTLSSWMMSMFEAELRAGRELEGRILAKHAADAATERPSHITSQPLRTRRNDPADADLDAALPPRRPDSSPRSLVVTRPPPPLPQAARPRAPEAPSPLVRSDPDLTPPRGMLAERLAAEMTSNQSAVKQVAPRLELYDDAATQIFVPRPHASSKPEPPDVPASAPLPVRASSTPMWIGGTLFLLAAGLLFVRQYLAEVPRVPPGTTSARTAEPAGAPLAAKAASPVTVAGDAMRGATTPTVQPGVSPRAVEGTVASERAEQSPRASDVPELAVTRELDPAHRSPREAAGMATRHRPASRKATTSYDRSAASANNSNAESSEAGVQPADSRSALGAINAPEHGAAEATRAVSNQVSSPPRPEATAAAPAAASAPAALAQHPRAPVIREAVPTSQDLPVFPARARRNGVHNGSVVVSLTVDRTGHVRNPIVVQSTPPGIFDEAAINAVLQWRYQPRLENGVPVESPKLHVRVRFAEAPQ